MTLTQLNYLYWIYVCGSFRRAAKELHVSQPSITEAVHALETELNQPLFFRKGSHAVFTEAGERVLASAQLFHQEEESLKEDLAELSRRCGQNIRLAVCLYTPLPLRVIHSFREAHPDVEVSLEQSSALHVIQALEQEECDLGVLYTEMLSSRELSLPYGVQEFGVFCPAGHEFLSHDTVPQELVLKEMERDGIREPEEAEGMQSGSYQASPGLSINARTLSGAFHPSLDPMLEALQARLNRRIAVLPANFSDDRGGLVFRRLSPPLYLPLSLTWNTKHFLSRETLELREALTAVDLSHDASF